MCTQWKSLKIWIYLSVIEISTYHKTFDKTEILELFQKYSMLNNAAFVKIYTNIKLRKNILVGEEGELAVHCRMVTLKRPLEKCNFKWFSFIFIRFWLSCIPCINSLLMVSFRLIKIYSNLATVMIVSMEIKDVECWHSWQLQNEAVKLINQCSVAGCLAQLCLESSSRVFVDPFSLLKNPGANFTNIKWWSLMPISIVTLQIHFAVGFTYTVFYQSILHHKVKFLEIGLGDNCQIRHKEMKSFLSLLSVNHCFYYLPWLKLASDQAIVTKVDVIEISLSTASYF